MLNAYHTARMAGYSAGTDEFLQCEKNLLDAGDYNEAFNIVAANLQTRCETFLFYAIFTLENIKTEFSKGKDWRESFNKIQKYNQIFQNDLEKMKILLDLKETDKCPF